jgi:hypothetical protein
MVQLELISGTALRAVGEYCLAPAVVALPNGAPDVDGNVARWWAISLRAGL